MAPKDETDTGPGREQTWGEALEARVAALEEKVKAHGGGGKSKPAADKGDKKAEDKAADKKEDK
jgi:hypothetical protein